MPRSIAAWRSRVVATGPKTCSTWPVVVAGVAVKPTTMASTALSIILRVCWPSVVWASSQMSRVTSAQLASST